jgi:hypothetical protein
MDINPDKPRFVPDLGIQEKPSLATRVRDRYRRLTGTSQYREIFGEKIYSYEGVEYAEPTKAVIRNGILVGEAALIGPVRADRGYVSPRERPGFAVGRCINISSGDFKAVIIDHDGQADYVIKKYHRHEYRGDGAREKARAALKKINAIYEVIEEICPQFVLPTERFIYHVPATQDREEGWAVYEKQQRAIFSSPWLSEEPEVADRITREIGSLSYKYHKKIVSELIRRGICKKEGDGSVAMQEIRFGLAYDARTRSLKEDDIIDYVLLDS